MIYNVTNIIEINYICKGYCKLPYPNHKKGCPNFNKNPNCPPNTPKVEEVFDIKKRIILRCRRVQSKNSYGADKT